MKKALALILATMMLLSCGSAFAEAEPVHFTYLGFTSMTFGEDTFTERYLEEAVPGIDIEPVFISHVANEQIAVTVSTGEMPDFAWLAQNPYTPVYMKENELIRSIPIEMFREYAPSYAALYDENPIMWALTTDPDDDTQLLCLCDWYRQNIEIYNWVWYLRYDWLQESGVDISNLNIEPLGENVWAADKGLSLEQTRQFLDYVVNGDPDKNGAADTVGYLKDYTKLLSGFGMIDGINEQEDGTGAPWYTDPRTKELLAWLRDAYADGLVYPEIFTLPWGGDWEILADGKAGLHTTGAGSYMQEWANERAPMTMIAKGMPVLVVPGAYEEGGIALNKRNTSPGGQNWGYVSAGVTDEQLIAILRAVEFMCFGNGDDTARVPLMFGEEGVDFEFDAETGIPTSLITREEKEAKGIGYFTGQIQRGQTWAWNNLVPGTYYNALMTYNLADDGYWVPGMRMDYIEDIFTQTNAASIKAEYEKDWTETRDAYFMKVIMGEKDLEGDWDAYIQALNDLEYGAYLEELNKVAPLEELLKAFE